MSVDSELATNTNTSASRQNLSIQLSSCVVTSVPGLKEQSNTHTLLFIWRYNGAYQQHFGLMEVYLSTRTRSSRSRAHFVLGQNTFTRQPASKLSSMCSAWANWFTVCRESVFGPHHMHFKRTFYDYKHYYMCNSVFFFIYFLKKYLT